ncbi:hypothetical protein ACLFLC_17645 [Providencia rettgeri]
MMELRYTETDTRSSVTGKVALAEHPQLAEDVELLTNVHGGVIDPMKPNALHYTKAIIHEKNDGSRYFDSTTKRVRVGPRRSTSNCHATLLR